MIPVVVSNVRIGEGKPKICVPIVGRSRSEILSQAELAGRMRADLAEWRADWFEGVSDHGQVIETAGMLKKILGEIPLLFTYRTLQEGGEQPIDAGTYANLNITAARSGCVDLVDVEAFTGDGLVKRVIDAVHETDVKVVVSNHDFHKTPDKGEIVRRLCHMQDLGADIAKIAVMPCSGRDVLTLLDATLEMWESHARCPLITMSMAGTGVISRLAGEIFGSAVTFGAAQKASAPGQVNVEDLTYVLNLIHREI